MATKQRKTYLRDAAGIGFAGHDYPLHWGVVDGRLANWRHPHDIAALQFSPLLYALPVGQDRRRIYFRADAGSDVGIREVEAMISGLRARCRESLIDYQLVSTATPFDRALYSFLEKRKRMG